MPHQQPGYQSGPAPARTSNVLSIIAIVCGAIAVLFLPIILGPLGLILGGVGKAKGEPLSTVALIVAGVGMVLGFVLSIVVFNATQG